MTRRAKRATGSGYSGTPLAVKLGIRDGAAVVLVGAPRAYRELLQPIPRGVRFATNPGATADIVQVFVTERAVLARALAAYRRALSPQTAVWVSWPKRSSGVATEVTEETIREIALPLGFVDVKVCAVNETWSALKLVVRKELR